MNMEDKKDEDLKNHGRNIEGQKIDPNWQGFFW